MTRRAGARAYDSGRPAAASVTGLGAAGERRAPPEFTSSRSSLPTLKNGTFLPGTSTLDPVNFPIFVSTLIQGVFQALVESSLE